MGKILEVKNLTVHIKTHKGIVQAVRGVDFYLNEQETLAVVGESGSGKSITMKGVMGILPKNGKVVEGSVMFQGNDLTKYTERQMQQVRGSEIAMIFQDPMTSLNPTMKVGKQIEEMLKEHRKEMSKADRKARAIELLSLVGISNPEARYGQYPHQLSGGMRQRVVIAIALACDPKVLIADDVKSTPVFSVGLFTKNGNDYTQVGTTQKVAAGSEVKFSTELNEQNKRYDLKEGIPYYIFEMDGDKRVENGASFQMPVVLDPKNSTTKTDTTFYVSYDCCDDDSKVAALTLTKDAPNASTIITNTTKNPAQIKVTKIATIDDNPADSHEATVALFTMDADGNYQAVSGQKKTITIAAGDKGKNSVTFDGLDSSKTYYVFELDADGKRVENDSTTTVKSAGSSKTFLATYSGNSSRVDLLPGIPGEKVITDANTTQVELSFAKT